MKIFIIILSRNGLPIITKCIKSVLGTLRENYSLTPIIVDNASTDNSVGKIKKLFPSIKILINKKNLGFASGNNVGINYALRHQADFLILLNQDAILKRNCIKNLLACINIDEKIGILSPKIYRFDKKIWFAGGKIDRKRITGDHIGLGQKDTGQYDKETETDFVSGCCMMIKKEVFEKIGLLDERFFLYNEDVDFCIRAKRKGFKIIFVPSAIIYHEEQSNRNVFFKEWHLFKSHLLLLLKHGSIYIKMREIIRLPKSIWEFSLKITK